MRQSNWNRAFTAVRSDVSNPEPRISVRTQPQVPRQLDAPFPALFFTASDGEAPRHLIDGSSYLSVIP